MEPEIAAALITVVGVVITAIVTIIVHLVVQRFNYNDLFARTVSENRMDWINVWRENISVFLSSAEVLHRNPDINEHDQITLLQKMLEARAMITTRLNMAEELHVLIFGAINQLAPNTPDEQFVAQREFIEELARKILKPEWERVKDEARGNKKY